MATPPPTSYRSSPPSSYGERPALYGNRRSFTTPHRLLSHHERAGLDRSDASADVLYSHPSTRIVKFTPSTTGIPLSTKPLSIDTDYPVDAIEVLPWSSTTETLLATGPLKIEKVQGSLNFLKCKDVTQAILRNSQCWLVDGVSKFVLRVGKLRYYRIELPAGNEEDARKVEDFKQALGKILRFEITPCPFKRGFNVELADSALTPRRKGQWRRREGLLPSSPLTETTPPLRHKTGRMWKPRATSYGLGSQATASPPRVDSGYDDSPPEEAEHEEPQTPQTVIHDSSDSEDDSEDEKRTPAQVSDEIEAMLSPRIATISEEEMEETVMTPVKVSDTPSVEGDSREDVEDEIRGLDAVASPLASPIIELEEPNISEEPSKASAVPQMQHEESLSPPVDIPERSISKSPVNSLGVPKSLANSQESLLFSLLLADTRRPPQPFPEHAGRRRTDSEGLVLTTEPSEDGNNDLSRRPTLESIPDDASIADSTDSFHTSASIVSNRKLSTPQQARRFHDGPTPLAEPYNLRDFWSPQDRSHRRDVSEMTITASSLSSPESLNGNAGAVLPHPSSPIIQSSLRHRVKSQQSPSPHPRSSKIARSSKPSEDKRVASAILQKAASVALVKPVELVVLMVHVLARIASGATMNDLMSGDLFKKPQQERSSGRRTQSMSLPDGIPDPNAGISEDEDDYGIPVRGRTWSRDLDNCVQVQNRDDDADSMADSLADLD